MWRTGAQSLRIGSVQADALEQQGDHSTGEVGENHRYPLVEALLEGAGSDWAKKQRATILTKSPTCTRIAFRQIRAGASLDFKDCMRLEYRLARFCMTQPDFYEGVRAVILDKDNAPKWNPATLAEADEAHVAPAFTPLGDEELALG